jgi:hypothetical protein
MSTQLRLVPTTDGETLGAGPWRLSDEEKAVGLQGLAEARAALRRSRAQVHADAA